MLTKLARYWHIPVRQLLQGTHMISLALFFTCTITQKNPIDSNNAFWLSDLHYNFTYIFDTTTISKMLYCCSISQNSVKYTSIYILVFVLYFYKSWHLSRVSTRDFGTTVNIWFNMLIRIYNKTEKPQVFCLQWPRSNLFPKAVIKTTFERESCLRLGSFTVFTIKYCPHGWYFSFLHRIQFSVALINNTNFNSIFLWQTLIKFQVKFNNHYTVQGHKIQCYFWIY